MNQLLPAILIVDDEENLRALMARVIELEGYKVLQAKDAKAAFKVLDQEDIYVVVTDVKLPDADGVELVNRIKAKFQNIEIIVFTAFGSINDGVRAMKNGAFDYLVKGDHQERLIPLINSASQKALLQEKVSRLEKKLIQQYGFDQIIGQSPAIRDAVDLAKKIAKSESPVLITGETGTGKEVFANAIHYEGPRSTKPFIAINCSAFSKDLLESELFGHTSGAFTGAVKDKKGLVEEAMSGSLFLDEIGELNLELQAKLLRFLETGEFYRLGDAKIRKVNVRVIAATNRNLEKEIEAGHFRSDLFYRLSVIQLTLPPLRNRTEDIEPLVNYFIQSASAKNSKRITGYDPMLLTLLKKHFWKGNVRELKNVISRCVILTDEPQLSAALLPSDFNLTTDESAFDLATLEKNHITKVLLHTKGNKTQSAKLLGIGLTTLYQKIKDYNL